MRFGFTEVKAEIWARFVEEAIRLLDEAGRELRGADAWHTYVQKRGALSQPKRKGKAHIHVPIEDGLTAELGHIARRLRAAVPLNHVLRLQEVVFETEHLIQSANRTGRHSRKVDFFIYSQLGTNAPEFAIEAKPLRSSADIRSRYLAEEGLGCFFATDSVYTHQPVAGMLSYSLGETPYSHLESLRTALEQLEPRPMATDQVDLSDPIRLICSRHERAQLNLTPVTIVHFEMMFPVEVGTSAPA
ncbi:hypothetical protein JP75_25235 [Devosia riboflavina]|uniref:Uncharacterized protein n=1 Tax=Devosia riboflavina TaxID=46914 RepID=A0A087LSE8_9HYPH|nr:hypothetical protein [Devosia riboflavina]KFL27551.1 hypothetical protein JP75_25235 [Devosia riboflavina]